MIKGRRHGAVAISLGALALGTATLPSPASALTVGIGDQQPSSFSDARLRALGLKTARLNVPWDAATSQPEFVQSWLEAVAAAGLQPQIAFEHLRSEKCPSAPCSAPTVAQYKSAVATFRARFPQVSTYTAWNEANHATQPVAQNPELVADYYEALRSVCPVCTVVAGDVLDSGSYVRWLQRFRAAAPDARLYGLHNYGDVTYGTTEGVDAVLSTVPGTLWLEETGGIVTLRNSAGRVTLSTNESRAATAIDRAFSSALARPRITRMSIYQWTAPATAQFDSGLIRADGTARPSYDALLRQMRALPADSTSRPTLATRWQKPAGKRLLVTVSCDEQCSGRLVIHLRGKKLGVRRYATASTQTVKLSVSLKQRKALRRVAPRRLVVVVDGLRTRVSVPKPTKASVQR